MIPPTSCQLRKPSARRASAGERCDEVVEHLRCEGEDVRRSVVDVAGQRLMCVHEVRLVEQRHRVEPAARVDPGRRSRRAPNRRRAPASPTITAAARCVCRNSLTTKTATIATAQGISHSASSRTIAIRPTPSAVSDGPQRQPGTQRAQADGDDRQQQQLGEVVADHVRAAERLDDRDEEQRQVDADQSEPAETDQLGDLVGEEERHEALQRDVDERQGEAAARDGGEVQRVERTADERVLVEAGRPPPVGQHQRTCRRSCRRRAGWAGSSADVEWC